MNSKAASNKDTVKYTHTHTHTHAHAHIYMVSYICLVYDYDSYNILLEA